MFVKTITSIVIFVFDFYTHNYCVYTNIYENVLYQTREVNIMTTTVKWLSKCL